MHKIKGFTLIEVAIVIMIAGLILASVSSLLLIYINQTNIKTTRHRIETIDGALQSFLNLNGRYPCPAPLDAATDSAGFGVEIASGFPAGSPTCSSTGAVSGTHQATGVLNGFDVRIGAVPVRSLNLPDEYIADAWGQRFTFAMTERLASDGTYDRDEGDVDLIDTAGNPIVNPARDPDKGLAHYVIVSHGKDGSGGTYIGGGSSPAPCTPGNPDGENCDNDAVFRRTMLHSSGASSMDDLIGYRANSAFGYEIPPGSVMAFNLHACPSGWVSYANASGRTIMGTGTLGAEDYDLNETGGEAKFNPDPDEVGLDLISKDLTVLPSGATPMAVQGSHEDHENRPPYVALLFCEKT